MVSVLLASLATVMAFDAPSVSTKKKDNSPPTVGKPAPEIEGEDIEGNSFKLSDYRGKVVVLDFWGNW